METIGLGIRTSEMAANGSSEFGGLISGGLERASPITGAEEELEKGSVDAFCTGGVLGEGAKGSEPPGSELNEVWKNSSLNGSSPKEKLTRLSAESISALPAVFVSIPTSCKSNGNCIRVYTMPIDKPCTCAIVCSSPSRLLHSLQTFCPA